ncbi:hypothetical protein F7Q99_38225 [Streptomyces kaniharaensis]|uniref:Uncharacterized protein n=1 Tax=Streptomyces kaniharaensis TaxID=212423 RepID=A0A6N7L204_9ACTN|nr:hypothetical protein [Streptomyces kaniharaensis]MQS17872.1 hypothetical protein [Streptomyces kaniharaensis]
MTSMTDSHEGQNTAPTINHQLITGLEGQYEAKVLALVIRDLSTVAPAAGESVVMKLVAEVWKQAADHIEKAATTWTHISWFIQDAISRFVQPAAQPQTAGC